MDRSPELASGNSTAFQSPLIAFVLTSLVIELTPGRNMAYLAVLGASRGRLAGFSAVLSARWDWHVSGSRSGLVQDR
jgi:hypothetical protein